MDSQNNFITRILWEQRPEDKLIVQLVFVKRLYYLDKQTFDSGDSGLINFFAEIN